MPLNILKHKSWNVYSPENIAKVKRDEQQAREAEEAAEQRMHEADKERRLKLLRGEVMEEAETPDTTDHHPKKKRRGRADDYDVLVEEREERMRAIPQPKIKSQSGHINFWADQEAGRTTSNGKNAEHEAEKILEKQKTLDPFTMRLDQPAKEMNPWYANRTLVSATESRKPQIDKDTHQRKQERSKKHEDPLAGMTAHLKVIQRKADQKTQQGHRRHHYQSPDRHARHHPDKSSQHDSELDALRQERKRREQKEAERTRQLTASTTTARSRGDNHSHRYSAQYNPEYARR